MASSSRYICDNGGTYAMIGVCFGALTLIIYADAIARTAGPCVLWGDDTRQCVSDANFDISLAQWMIAAVIVDAVRLGVTLALYGAWALSAGGCAARLRYTRCIHATGLFMQMIAGGNLLLGVVILLGVLEHRTTCPRDVLFGGELVLVAHAGVSLGAGAHISAVHEYALECYLRTQK